MSAQTVTGELQATIESAVQSGASIEDPTLVRAVELVL